jgi:tetratricopeptide (TPR) repeat protein
MKTPTLKALAFAAVLLATGKAEAQLEPLHRANADPGSPLSNSLASDSAEAIIAGHPYRALRTAKIAIKTDPRNPWGYYDKADALTLLHRVDEAVAAFRQAEQHFSAADRWGKSIAIYGRANVLRQANRCEEAAGAFREYAAFVQKDDPGSADMARRYSIMC